MLPVSGAKKHVQFSLEIISLPVPIYYYDGSCTYIVAVKEIECPLHLSCLKIGHHTNLALNLIKTVKGKKWSKNAFADATMPFYHVFTHL